MVNSVVGWWILYELSKNQNFFSRENAEARRMAVIWPGMTSRCVLPDIPNNLARADPYAARFRQRLFKNG
jgi:hypothetical protein